LRWDRSEEIFSEVIHIDKSNPPSGTAFLSVHELVHNGHLYDVLKTEISGNIITCYCERDSEEENGYALISISKSTLSNEASLHSPHLVVKSGITDYQPENFIPVFFKEKNCRRILTTETKPNDCPGKNHWIPPDVA
jgi:hypothetical protein